MKESAALDLLSKVGRWQIEKTLLMGFSLTPLSWHYLVYPLLSVSQDFVCAKNITSEDHCYANEDELCEEWTFIKKVDGILTLQQDFGLVCSYERLLSVRQTIFFLGMLVGCLITGSISDRYGRKPTMLILMAIWSASAFLHVVVPNFITFLVLQFSLAFAAQSSWTCAWIWNVEIFGRNDKMRVIWCLSTMLYWAAGFITSSGIVYVLPNWRMTFLAMTIPTLIFLSYCWCIPESPLWLLNKGRTQEAEAILIEIAEKNNIDITKDLLDDPNTTESAVDKSEDHEDVNACFSLMATPNIRSRTMIISFSFFVASFVYYGLSLNQSSVGGEENLFLTFTLFGVMEIPAIIFAILVLSFLGRRLPTVFMFLFAGSSCLAAALVENDVAKLCLAVFGKLCITACFHALFVYTSELFSTPNRNTGLSVCSVFARVAGMTAPYVGELKYIDPFLPIAVFGGCGIFAAFFATFLPETKGKELPNTIEENENFAQGDTLWSSMCSRCNIG